MTIDDDPRVARRVYVDPAQGSDARGDGTQLRPLRTFARARELLEQESWVVPTELVLLSDSDRSDPFCGDDFARLGVQAIRGEAERPPRLFARTDPRDPFGATRVR
jgi:hypothetical protein